MDADQITVAKAALEGARAAFEHCPSAENDEKVQHAQDAMDKALDSWASQSRAS